MKLLSAEHEDTEELVPDVMNNGEPYFMLSSPTCQMLPVF